MTRHAVGSVSVSSKEQVDGCSLDAQEGVIREECTRQGADAGGWRSSSVRCTYGA
jgi:hypothetical protein